MDTNVIYNADCIGLDGMYRLPDKSIDLVLTDPPYGIGESNEKNMSRGNCCKPTDYQHYDWDKERLGKQYFDEMLRISKNQIIFGGNYYTDFLPPSSCWIVWDKDNGDNDFADCELAWCSFNTAVRKFKWRWNGMLQEDMANKEKRIHPTQKPVPLFEWILNKYSKQGDIICDPFSGSGSVAVACWKTQRKFICFEKVSKYYADSMKRIEPYLKQQRLM